MTYLFEKELKDYSNRRYYNNSEFKRFFNSIRLKIKYILSDNLLQKDIIVIFEKICYLAASSEEFRTKMEEYGDIVYIIPEDCYEC